MLICCWGWPSSTTPHSLEEAAALLSNREKLAVLGNRTGFERLCQLVTACHDQEP